MKKSSSLLHSHGFVRRQREREGRKRTQSVGEEGSLQKPTGKLVLVCVLLKERFLWEDNLHEKSFRNLRPNVFLALYAIFPLTQPP